MKKKGKVLASLNDVAATQIIIFYSILNNETVPKTVKFLVSRSYDCLASLAWMAELHKTVDVMCANTVAQPAFKKCEGISFSASHSLPLFFSLSLFLYFFFGHNYRAHESV